MAGLGLMLAGQVTAQTFKTLHSFTAGQTNSAGFYTNSDGGSSQAGLIISGNTLYGTTYQGGSSADGAIFAINTDGTGFTNLHNFAGYPGDGAYPLAGLVSSSNTLYGTTYGDGSQSVGTAFRVGTNGGSFTNLYNFTVGTPNSTIGSPTNINGASPHAGLIASGNILYGTAQLDGTMGDGTVFAINNDGTGITNLHNFTVDFFSNGDGANPYAGLILSSNILYGTTSVGGSSSVGVVFRVNSNGTDFTNLHNFSGYPGDGAYPYAGLILSGNTLYGTASGGGGSAEGTVFRVNIDGTDFTNLHSFAAIPSSAPLTNSDGAVPHAGLTLSSNTLYGTTELGGALGGGTVFALNTDGTGFTNVYSFAAATTNGSGSGPNSLVLAGNTLYGTTVKGGTSGNGTVFSLALVSAPRLALSFSGANVILTWPTNATGFVLEATTNLGAATVWSTNPASPSVVNGQNAVTNQVSLAQRFFRLSQ